MNALLALLVVLAWLGPGRDAMWLFRWCHGGERLAAGAIVGFLVFGSLVAIVGFF